MTFKVFMMESPTSNAGDDHDLVPSHEFGLKTEKVAILEREIFNLFSEFTAFDEIEVNGEKLYRKRNVPVEETSAWKRWVSRKNTFGHAWEERENGGHIFRRYFLSEYGYVECESWDDLISRLHSGNWMRLTKITINGVEEWALVYDMGD